jgi:hypothetical protein
VELWFPRKEKRISSLVLRDDLCCVGICILSLEYLIRCVLFVLVLRPAFSSISNGVSETKTLTPTKIHGEFGLFSGNFT